jgi:hypothetical protein
MKHLTHWILALVAIAAVASLSGAWSSTQEPKRIDKKAAPPAQGNKKNPVRDRAAKHAAILRVMPTFRVTLSEAIQIAEKETGGKAFSAGIEIIAGKPLIQVNQFVNDKFTATQVDPLTRKFTIITKSAGDEHAAEGEGEGDEGG